MAKETQKAKMERLENELSQWIEIYNTLNDKLKVMQENGDNSFLNCTLYKELLRENKELKVINKTLNSAYE